MDNTQNIISFCSGYSGLDRGIELAGVKARTVAYVEIEAFAVANLVAKMETGLLVPAPVWTNLKTFPMEAFRGRVHGITAGYPCQPFSVAGQRKGTDDPRHLWPYIRRIYQTIQPGWMFFENVEGHVTLGLSTVVSDMEEDGYKVEAGLFTAAEVGASQIRKRLFILAYSMCKGLQGRWGHESSSKERLSQHIGDGTPFPAPQGGRSYDWENARLKPRMAGESNGITYKVDRLRILGNGVVPQQAARAWQVLNRKMEENQ